MLKIFVEEMRREVLRATLYHKKSGGSWKKRAVAAFCGTQSADKAIKSVPAQLQLYEDYKKAEKPGQKPKRILQLLGAKIGSNYTQGNSSAYSTTITVPENCRSNISSSSSSAGSYSGSGTVGSGSGSGSFISGTHIFTISTQGGEIHEFRTECEDDKLRWVKLLQLLVIFPYSSIPEEPITNPIKDSLISKMDPKQFGEADSIWAVYILSEEVGPRLGIIGVHVIVLRSGVPNVSIGSLEIYNLADASSPLVSWDRDKMRRTGETGQLVFIEIGRRCTGGPGLVWMYTKYSAQALRQTLHNFLFQGDGKVVAIPTTQQGVPIYDIPRASFDSSLPPSHSKRNSVPSGSHNHVLTRIRSHDQDSGDPSSPSDKTLPLEGPPVRLDKHPSIQGSKPCDTKRTNSTPSASYASNRDVVVAIPTTQQGVPIYDIPRASFDSSLPPSHSKRNSVPSGYHNHVLTRIRSHDQDSGDPSSPSDKTLPLEGPPVRLDKHPSIQGSKPCDTKRTNSTPSGSCASDRDISNSTLARSGDSIQPVFERDESSTPNDQSCAISPQEKCNSEIIGEMEPEHVPSITFYDEVPPHRRSQTVLSFQGMQEHISLPGWSQSTASCSVREYKKMVHPTNSAMSNYDTYVYMKPAEIPRSDPISVSQGSNHLNHFPRRSPQ